MRSQNHGTFDLLEGCTSSAPDGGLLDTPWTHRCHRTAAHSGHEAKVRGSTADLDIYSALGVLALQGYHCDVGSLALLDHGPKDGQPSKPGLRMGTPRSSTAPGEPSFPLKIGCALANGGNGVTGSDA
jgi:hypothetical protein